MTLMVSREEAEQVRAIVALARAHKVVLELGGHRGLLPGQIDQLLAQLRMDIETAAGIIPGPSDHRHIR